MNANNENKMPSECAAATEPSVSELLEAMEDGYEKEVQGICQELSLLTTALLDMDSGIDWSKASDDAKRRVFDLQTYLVGDGYLTVAADLAKPA